MEAAIRWSPKASLSDARFLIVDAEAHTIKLCEALGVRHGKIQWNEISRNSKVSAFRAFDWSAAHDIVAVGHYAGASIVGLHNESPSLNLPLKLPRVCNAVAFNSERLLASGVERVRNDYCLNVYDVSHWPAAASSPTESRAVEPSHKLSMSEAITSIKFFPSSPQVLAAGVKGTSIRIYDLRERTGNPMLQYQTTRVHNVAVDLSDDNYFASAGSTTARDSTVQVWDKRHLSRQDARHETDKPCLEITRAVNGSPGEELPNVWSLRFSPEKRGSLGVMGSNGTVNICSLQKDYSIVDEMAEIAEREKYSTSLTVRRTQLITYPTPRQTDKSAAPSAGKGRVVSFDFMNMFSSTGKHRIITLGLHQDAHVHEMYDEAPVLGVSRKGFIAATDSKNVTGVQAVGRDLAALGVRLLSTNMIGNITAKQEMQTRGVLNYARAAVRKESADTWKDWEDQVDQPATKPTITERVPVQSPLQRVYYEDMKRRVKQGYLLDAGKNATIMSDVPTLNLFWKWVQAAMENAREDAMVGEGKDFSFLGVKNIITATLGSEPGLRSRSNEKDVSYAISWLAANLGLTGIEVKEGDYTARRRLGLHALGFRNDNLKERVQQLAMAGQNSEAALRALILCDNSLVLGALTNGPRRRDVSFLFDDVHRWLSTGHEFETERCKMINAYLNQEEDPFTHSIYHIMLSNGRQSVSQFDNKALPFHYRLAMVLRYVEDEGLREYVDDETRLAIRSGSMDKIMLTGLSDEGIVLIQNYLYFTNDIQTATLATAQVVPRYVQNHPEALRWREGYRTMLNSWHYFIERCTFDMQCTRLADDHTDTAPLGDPNPPQIALCCSNCDGPFMQDGAIDDSIAGPKGRGTSTGQSGTRSFGAGVLGGPNEVTQCPRCGARMPHCAVCDMPTGVLDPLSRGGAEKEKEDLENGHDPLDDLMEVCMTCDHVLHHGCSEAWFTKHAVCPAVGCDCCCNELDDLSDDEEE